MSSSNYYNNIYSRSGSSLINGFRNLGEENSNKYENKKKSKKTSFFTQNGNSVEGITEAISSTQKISSPYSSKPYYKNDYNPLEFSSTGKQNYSNSYNLYNNNSTNNYGLSQTMPQVPSSKKKYLSNSVIDTSDNIYDKYYEKRKQSNNHEVYNKDNDSNSNSYYNLIITSKVGLTNLGNTCFMNTCLQNLIHSEDFIKRLVSKSNIINSNTPITLKFYNLCKSMATEKAGNIAPSEFKLKFGSKHSLFSGYGQNDTQEFCRFLLEDMNKELNEVRHKPPYKELNTSGKSKIVCDKEFDELFRSRESSIVMDSFYGQIINIFTCKCKYKTYSFQKVLDLPLLLRNTNMSVSLFELLDDYFEGEEIQFETKCEQCKKKRVHEKEVKISRPPNILILSIQRINPRTQRKNSCMVEFVEELNLKKYIDEECGHGNECNYELYGVGCHRGTINFGHYFAYVKLKGAWHEFNDSMVYKIGRINTSSTEVYTLFYKKKM